MEFKFYLFIFALTFCCPALGQNPRTTPCSQSELETIAISSQTCLMQGMKQEDISSDSNPVSHNIAVFF
jgi:hypothetical protein